MLASLNESRAVEGRKLVLQGLVHTVNGLPVANTSHHYLLLTSPARPLLALMQAVKQIEWSDAYFRSDIGWRAVARLRASASH